MGQQRGYRHAATSYHPAYLGISGHRPLVVVCFLALLLVESVVGMQTIHGRLTSLHSPVQIASAAAAPQPAPLPQPDQLPATAAGLREDYELDALLEGWQKDHSTHTWAIYVEGIEGENRYAGLQQAKTYVTASFFKLFLLYSIQAKYEGQDLDAVYIKTSNGQQTVGKCLDLALRMSDNACGIAFGDTLGWSKNDKLLRVNGFTATTLGSYGDQVTNPQETAKLLKNLYTGNTLSGTVQERSIAALAKQKYRAGIPAGISGCNVMNKTGDLGWLRHDAAIVECASYSYVIAIMTNGASFKEIAELSRLIHGHISNT